MQILLRQVDSCSLVRQFFPVTEVKTMVTLLTLPQMGSLHTPSELIHFFLHSKYIYWTLLMLGIEDPEVPSEKPQLSGESICRTDNYNYSMRKVHLQQKSQRVRQHIGWGVSVGEAEWHRKGLLEWTPESSPQVYVAALQEKRRGRC